MFKKLNLFLALSFMILGANAQKANIQSAFNYLKDKDVAGAKKMIDEAVVNESTKNNAKAWLLKDFHFNPMLFVHRARNANSPHSNSSRFRRIRICREFAAFEFVARRIRREFAAFAFVSPGERRA